MVGSLEQRADHPVPVEPGSGVAPSAGRRRRSPRLLALCATALGAAWGVGGAGAARAEPTSAASGPPCAGPATGARSGLCPGAGSMLTPTLQMAAGVSSNKVPVGHFFAGLAFFPRLARSATRLAVGLTVEARPPAHDRERGTQIEIVPVLHLGVSWLRPRRRGEKPTRIDRFWRAWISRLNVYAVLGTRLPRPGRHTAIRVGLGLSSPWLLVTAAKNTRGRAAIVPNFIEGTADIDLVDGTPRFLLKFGWGI